MKKIWMLGACGALAFSLSNTNLARAENAATNPAGDTFLREHVGTYDSALPGQAATGTLTCPVCETSETAEPAPFQQLEATILGNVDPTGNFASIYTETNETPASSSKTSTPSDSSTTAQKAAQDSDAPASCGCTPYFWKFDFQVDQVLTLTEGKWVGKGKPPLINPCFDQKLVTFAGKATDADFAGCYSELDKHIMDYWSQRNEGPKKEVIGGICEYTYQKRFKWYFLDGERCRMCGGGCLPLVL